MKTRNLLVRLDADQIRLTRAVITRLHDGRLPSRHELGVLDDVSKALANVQDLGEIPIALGSQLVVDALLDRVPITSDPVPLVQEGVSGVAPHAPLDSSDPGTSSDVAESEPPEVEGVLEPRRRGKPAVPQS